MLPPRKNSFKQQENFKIYSFKDLQFNLKQRVMNPSKTEQGTNYMSLNRKIRT
jgi:hypothetical protein